jgi:hypothetical protein
MSNPNPLHVLLGLNVGIVLGATAPNKSFLWFLWALMALLAGAVALAEWLHARRSIRLVDQMFLDRGWKNVGGNSWEPPNYTPTPWPNAWDDPTDPRFLQHVPSPLWDNILSPPKPDEADLYGHPTTIFNYGDHHAGL